VLYGSLSSRAVNLHKPLACSPCLTAYNHRRSPCDGDNVCLKSISTEEVLAVADDLLGTATSGGSRLKTDQIAERGARTARSDD